MLILNAMLPEDPRLQTSEGDNATLQSFSICLVSWISLLYINTHQSGCLFSASACSSRDECNNAYECFILSFCPGACREKNKPSAFTFVWLALGLALWHLQITLCANALIRKDIQVNKQEKSKTTQLIKWAVFFYNVLRVQQHSMISLRLKK